MGTILILFRQVIAKEIILIGKSILLTLALYLAGHVISKGFFLVSIISLLYYPILTIYRIWQWSINSFTR